MVVGVAGAVFAAQPRDETPPVDPPKPPALVAKPEEAPVPKEEPKPADKAIEFAAPRMQKVFDESISGYLTLRWNATGTHLAASGQEAGAGGKRGVPIVRLFGTKAGADHVRAYPGGFSNEGVGLVAVLPDGKGIVTDLREYHLISGHHQLKFWAEPPPPPPGPAFGGPLRVNELVVARTVELDLPETHGYAFSADMKTYRTVAYHRDATGTPTKLEVLEVDTGTGKAGKSLLKADYGEHALADNGKRLAVVAKDGPKVTVYDLDRGTKVCSADLADAVPEHFPAGQTFVVVLSPDGRRLVVARGPGRTWVLDAETGTALPAPEGSKECKLFPDVYTFTGDGRLLAALGERYEVKTAKGPGGREQTAWRPVGNFLAVWDTQTGKALKTWDRGQHGSTPQIAFNPARPLLAILEQNGESGTRVGFWDFAAEVGKK
jgi:hypothetical protein